MTNAASESIEVSQQVGFSDLPEEMSESSVCCHRLWCRRSLDTPLSLVKGAYERYISCHIVSQFRCGADAYLFRPNEMSLCFTRLVHGLPQDLPQSCCWMRRAFLPGSSASWVGLVPVMPVA